MSIFNTAIPTDVSKDNKFTENTSPVASSSFYFLDSEIDALRWSESFPYQLMILEAVNGADGKISYRRHWTYTLPIPPQELNISMPIATNLQATMEGIVEINNGAPFRDIVLNGTTGITVIKNNATPKDTPVESTLSILGGNSSAQRNLANAASVALTGSPLQMNNVNTGLGNGPDQIPEKSTGYYQYRLLERFLESFIELKRRNTQAPGLSGVIANTRNLRLAFCIWKDEAVFLVSGTSLTKKRSAQNPMEYMYSLQMRAWKRIKPSAVGDGTVQSAHQFVARSPNGLANLLNRVQAANYYLTKSADIMNSIVPNAANRVGLVARQTTLFLKNALKIPANVADYPNTLQNELVGPILQNWQLIAQQFPDLGQAPPSTLVDGMGKYFNTPIATNRSSQNNNQIPQSNTSDIKLFDIFNTIVPSRIPLPTVLQQKLQDQQDQVAQFNRLDFEQMRKTINEFTDAFVDSIGAGAETYNLNLGKEAPDTQKVPTEDEFNILYSLNDMAIALDHLSASTTIDPPAPSSLEYVAGLAEQSGIAFQIPVSKFAVPFPYGYTLERLALQYLNDANRWQEIATLNGLRAPYIDEEGFKLPFLTNGEGNMFYVSDASNLYINQVVYISSLNQFKTSRRITNIKQIYDGFVSITVDGEANMSLYTTVQSAIVEAFLPGTVNSQQLIYIPSQTSPVEDPGTKEVPGVDQYDPLLQVSGIDLLMTMDGDLIVTPDGDTKLAYGLQNIVQQVKIALSTPKGSLLQHPEFGISIAPGTSTADVDAKDLVRSAVEMFSNDSTFEGVISASVEKNGPVCKMTLVLKVKGLNQNIPISVNIIT